MYWNIWRKSMRACNDDQIISTHIAVEIGTHFLCHLSDLESAFGRVSERLSCTFAYATRILFTLCLAALTFCHQNTVCTYACNCVHRFVLCSSDEYPQLRFMQQDSADDDADNHCHRDDVSGNF